LRTLVEAYGGTERPPPEVLIFIDSTTLLVSRLDLSRRTLIDMILKELRSSRVCVVGHIAHHAAVHEALLDVVAALPTQPRVVALPINIRQLSPQWIANPNFQFSELIQAARTLAADPAHPIPPIAPFPSGDLTASGASADPEEWQQFRATPVTFPGRPERTVGDYIDVILTTPSDEASRAERFRSIFAYHFASGSDEAPLRALDGAIRVANSFGATVLGHFSPLNYQAGTRLLGPSFDEMILSRTKVLSEVCHKAAGANGIVLKDLSKLLPSSEFFYDTDPTEHYDEFGRRKLAKILGQSIAQVATKA